MKVDLKLNRPGFAGGRLV